MSNYWFAKSLRCQAVIERPKPLKKGTGIGGGNLFRNDASENVITYRPPINQMTLKRFRSISASPDFRLGLDIRDMGNDRPPVRAAKLMTENFQSANSSVAPYRKAKQNRSVEGSEKSYFRMSERKNEGDNGICDNPVEKEESLNRFRSISASHDLRQGPGESNTKLGSDGKNGVNKLLAKVGRQKSGDLPGQSSLTSNGRIKIGHRISIMRSEKSCLKMGASDEGVCN